MSTFQRLFNKACDFWAFPLIQVAVFAFFVIGADHKYMAGDMAGTYQFVGFSLMPIYFLVIRPALRKHDLV
jgi:hypothetical protein